MTALQQVAAARNAGRVVEVSPDLLAHADGDVTCNAPLSLIESSTFTRWGHGLSGPLHCYVDDYRFSVCWRSPVQGLVRAASAGLVVAPDFSAPESAPYIFVQYQQWRSETVLRFWQAHGVMVIPSLSFTANVVPEFAVRPGSVVAVRGPAREAEGIWHDVVPQIVAAIRPSAVVQFGRHALAYLWQCPVIHKPLRGCK